MKATPVSRTAICFLLGLLLLGCTRVTPTPPPAASGGEIHALIGFTASNTGALNVESTRQTNGFNLWMEQVNANGGVRLRDGSVVKFDARYYDDESSKSRVQELYTRLVTRDNATFLISPYSSGLANAAAVVAQQYDKIMITTGAASDATYRKGYTLVYQAYSPASRYLTGAVDLLQMADPAAEKIAIIHENEKFSTDVANALNSYAVTRGYDIVLLEGYDTGTTDFAPFINKIETAGPEAIMGGGHFQDGTTFARQLYEKQVPADMVALLVAPAEPTFSEIGEGARGIIGPSQWESQVAFTAESAGRAGLPFYGPDSAGFVARYRAAYGEDPSYHAAGGYVAGLILQYAVEMAGSLDTESVGAVLDGMNILTFFGRIQFSAAEVDHGLQIGHSMVYIQWQPDATGVLRKQVVWPVEGATAEILYPIR